MWYVEFREELWLVCLGHMPTWRPIGKTESVVDSDWLDLGQESTTWTELRVWSIWGPMGENHHSRAWWKKPRELLSWGTLGKRRQAMWRRPTEQAEWEGDEVQGGLCPGQHHTNPLIRLPAWLCTGFMFQSYEERGNHRGLQETLWGSSSGDVVPSQHRVTHTKLPLLWLVRACSTLRAMTKAEEKMVVPCMALWWPRKLVLDKADVSQPPVHSWMSGTHLSVGSSGGHCHKYAAVSVSSCVGAPPSSPRDVRETGSTWEEERIILAFAVQGHVPVTLLNSLHGLRWIETRNRFSYFSLWQSGLIFTHRLRWNLAEEFDLLIFQIRILHRRGRGS